MTTSRRPHFADLMLIPVIMMLFAAISFAADKATIRLKSGEEYKDASFTVNDFYKTIQIDTEDTTINASFSDIESITNQSGQDVTPKVLGRYYRPTQETWLSGESKEVRKAQSRPWKILLNLGGNYSFPVGDYYEGIVSGMGFDGDIRFALNNRTALQIMVSRSGMKVGDDIRLISLDPRLTILDEQLKIAVTRYEVAVNFFQPLSRINESRSMWYGYSGLGMTAHVTSTKATFRNNTTGDIIYVNEKDTQNKFSMVMGFGAVTMITKGFGLDFSGSLDLVAVPTESNEPGQSLAWGYIFDLKFGALYLF